MNAYPLIFKFSRPVKTDNFHVAIAAQGRILMKQEFEKWWVYGVTPGSIAESGRTPTEAYYNFLNSFWGVVADISNEQQDCHSFISALNEFIKAGSAEDEKEWQEARNAVRSGQLSDSDPFLNLEKITREAYPSITYKRLDEDEKQKMALDTNKYNNDELLLAKPAA